MTTVSSRRIKPKSCREARLRQTSTPQPVPQRRASAQLEENSARQQPSKTRLFQTFSSLRLSLQSHRFQSIEFSSAYQDKTVVELLPQSSSSSIVGNERTWNVSGSSSGVGSLASAHSNRMHLAVLSDLIWSDLQDLYTAVFVHVDLARGRLRHGGRGRAVHRISAATCSIQVAGDVLEISATRRPHTLLGSTGTALPRQNSPVDGGSAGFLGLAWDRASWRESPIFCLFERVSQAFLIDSERQTMLARAWDSRRFGRPAFSFVADVEHFPVWLLNGFSRRIRDSMARMQLAPGECMSACVRAHFRLWHVRGSIHYAFVPCVHVEVGQNDLVKSRVRVNWSITVNLKRGRGKFDKAQT